MQPRQREWRHQSLRNDGDMVIWSDGWRARTFDVALQNTARWLMTSVCRCAHRPESKYTPKFRAVETESSSCPSMQMATTGSWCRCRCVVNHVSSVVSAFMLADMTAFRPPHHRNNLLSHGIAYQQWSVGASHNLSVVTQIMSASNRW